MASTLADGGYDVVVGSGGSEPLTTENLNEGETPGSITYVGLGELPPPEASIIDKSFQIFAQWGKKTVEWLDSLPSKPSYVIVYGGSAQYMFRLLPWCRRNRIPLIADVVEWYDSRQMTGGFFGPFNISAKMALLYQYPKCNGIIAISSYLADRYHKQGCQVICIPPTLDVAAIRARTGETSSQPLKLAYTGVPGKKDLLDNVLESIMRLDPSGKTVKITIAGPNHDVIAKLPAISKRGLTKLPNCIDAPGRVSRDQALNIVRQADFSVLLRPNLRYAQAGFPTKVVE